MRSPEHDEILAGGNMAREVRRVGETVRRPAGPWTPAVHHLLRHLEHVGFQGAPRVLGIDEQAREILSFIPGDVVHPRVVDDADLARVACLIRAIHTAAASFVVPADARWQAIGRDPSGVNELICHNDLAPWNLIVGEHGWAFIDWDMAATIRILQAQLLTVDQTIARELRELRALPAHARTIDSVPGLGPVWTAGLVAEIGNIQRFPDDAAVAKYAGLVWPPHESGDFQAQDSRLSKAGNSYLRYYLVEAANSVRQHCPEYRHYYLTKFAQSPKHSHQRALVLTARKLVRLVDALLRTGSVYRPPTTDQNQEEVRTTPHAARPRPQRRARLVPSAS